MDQGLLANVLDRIDRSDAISDAASLLVLAACEGPSSFAQVLEGIDVGRPVVVAVGESPEPVGAYLSRIEVEGFRGIGPRRALDLVPGPGLTLVIGRNGSGKSSFAEGLEVLLTGDSRRWTTRKEKAWKEGWRNLHHAEAGVCARVAIDGVAGETEISGTWSGDDVAALTVEVKRAGEKASSLATLGWSGPLVTMRPFLSYNELSSILDEGPSKLYDAIAGILGLDDLAAALEQLTSTRLELDRNVKDAKARAKTLDSALAAADDERVASARALLKAHDIPGLEQLVLGVAPDQSEIAFLQRLAALESPDATEISEACDEARAAAEEVVHVAGTDAEAALRTADLLSSALEFHEHGDAPCPVCGAGVLDADWRSRSEQEVRRLRELAAGASNARRRAEQSRSRLESLVGRPPQILEQARPLGAVSVDACLEAWEKLGALPDSLRAAADHVASYIENVVTMVDAVRAEAARELERRTVEWTPIAEQITAWLPLGRDVAKRKQTLVDVKEAETWLKGSFDEIRDDRLAPIRVQAAAVWAELRQQSNIDLGPISLTGTGNRRRVALDVTVDGVKGVALSVMSQGELHALALSLFLPRATLDESPFRFVVIDDPVQAMDPAKVDGLARVLETVSTTRQVVVFTHDDRLPEAVRRLGIDARVVEVVRSPGSVVEIREVLDPAIRYFEDADAVALTHELPAAVRAQVVPGLCRLGLESVLADVARRRLLNEGRSHTDVEDALRSCTTLATRGALAFFGDSSRGGDVLGKVNSFARKYGDTWQACNKGAHEGYDGDLVGLTRSARELAGKLRTVK